jgi:hypothetical protein
LTINTGRARWNKDGTATLFLNSNTSYEIRFLPRPIVSAQSRTYRAAAAHTL